MEERERAHHARMLELLATTTAPFDRLQFDPGHFTASALVISRHPPAVLLIRHPTLGLWLQPGGHVEPGDPSPREGALREVIEETGLDTSVDPALFDLDIHEIPTRGTAPAHLHFDLRFLAIAEGRPAPFGRETIEGRWLAPDDALRLTTDASVRRMLTKAFGTR